MACTEAGITAGFHVIGDAAVAAALAALEQTVERFGAPAVARCGHRLEHLEMVSAEQAAALGRWGITASMQPSFDALWGGPTGMYARRLGSGRAAALNPLALLASAGVPLAFGSDSPVTSMNPWSWIRAASLHQTQGSAISTRAAFVAATRGAWRAGGIRDGITGTLVPGAAASYAVWETGDLDVTAPADSVQRWSTDPRSRVPALPRLDTGDPLPHCRQTVRRGAVVHG
jgi:predicted amidohydrolase YtcJ